MSHIAIHVENLSKAYRIGLNEQRHETLAGAMAALVRSPFENFRNVRKLARFDDAFSNSKILATSTQGTDESNLNPQPSDIIWALKDVSFDVNHGEVLGIIGRNGAGKSTLLKILARITEPTSGRAFIYGRVGSLLEVGTGFHPDLTGRENVYLNGTILGMRKNEVDQKFDEIVAFSEVEKFIDTPVKRYSSGMRVRLAFAVAAHLDPEILIIDEVLAVGDAGFQRKCLGKMDEVAKAGRTVLFVSHNLNSVRRLCTSGLLLENGNLAVNGSTEACLNRYTTSDHLGLPRMVFAKDASKAAQFLEIQVRGVKSQVNRVSQDEEIQVFGRIQVNECLRACLVAVAICSDDGNPVFTTTECDFDALAHAPQKEAGDYCFEFQIPGDLLVPGRYHVRLGLGVPGHHKFDQHASSVAFEIDEDARPNLGRGILSLRLKWLWHGESRPKEFTKT